MKSLNQYINEAKIDPVAQSLAEYIGCDVSEITKQGKDFYSRGEEEYYVFPSHEKACTYVRTQFGPEYCNGATEDETWYKMIDKYCDGDKATLKRCFPNGVDGTPNYKAIAKVVLEAEGPEWFLSGYDGHEMVLDYKNYVAYRYN